MQTSCPSLAKYTATLVASVLLPHPPLALRTIIWRIIPRPLLLSTAARLAHCAAGVRPWGASAMLAYHAHRVHEDAGARQRLRRLRRPAGRRRRRPPSRPDTRA